VTDVSDLSLIEVQFIFLAEITTTPYFSTGVTHQSFSSNELLEAKL